MSLIASLRACVFLDLFLVLGNVGVRKGWRRLLEYRSRLGLIVFLVLFLEGGMSRGGLCPC